jgi:hypothetical protein
MDQAQLFALVAASVTAGVLIAIAVGRQLSRPRLAPAQGVVARQIADNSFRVRLYAEAEWTRVSLVSVHGDFLKVADAGPDADLRRFGTVVLEQVHPDDRERVATLAGIHPTARDRYEFLP